MQPKFLSPDEVEKLMKFAENPYRPKEILQLEEEIEGETRVAEVRFVSTGVIDQKHAQMIVQMMLKKDGLYAAWARGEIE